MIINGRRKKSKTVEKIQGNVKPDSVFAFASGGHHSSGEFVAELLGRPARASLELLIAARFDLASDRVYSASGSPECDRPPRPTFSGFPALLPALYFLLHFP